MKVTRKRLEKIVAGIVTDLQETFPGCPTRITYQTHEGEDAYVIVDCPEDWEYEKCEAVGLHGAGITLKLQLEKDLWIPILVIEPQERVRRENEEYRASLRNQKTA